MKDFIASALAVCVIWLLFVVASHVHGFDAERQADLADEIVGYRIMHSHLLMEWVLTEELSEIIGKEIYRLCTMMWLPSLMMCNIGVRNWNRILAQ